MKDKDNNKESNKEKDINQYIKIRKAREHNLQNIDIDIPKNKLIVITGVSRLSVNHLLLLIQYMQKGKEDM